MPLDHLTPAMTVLCIVIELLANTSVIIMNTFLIIPVVHMLFLTQECANKMDADPLAEGQEICSSLLCDFEHFRFWHRRSERAPLGAFCKGEDDVVPLHP